MNIEEWGNGVFDSYLEKFPVMVKKLRKATTAKSQCPPNIPQMICNNRMLQDLQTNTIKRVERWSVYLCGEYENFKVLPNSRGFLSSLIRLFSYSCFG